MTEKIKSAVWAEGQKNQMNRAFAFVLDLGKKQMGEICLSAASCYKVIADLWGSVPTARLTAMRASRFIRLTRNILR